MGNERRLSPAMIVSMIALVVGLGGSAAALPGKNSVDKNDIKKNAVKSKAIKNGQVKAADIADGGVGSAEIADGGVAGTDLAPDEPFHRVGGGGEPAFGNGNEGDCLWTNGVAPGASINPAAFYIDSGGVVHLAGVVQSVNGAGGDATCDDTADARVYTLPPAYRPENLELIPLNAPSGPSLIALIGSDEDTIVGPDLIAAGSVNISGTLPTTTTFDGVSFRAAGAGDNGLAPTRAGRTSRVSGALLGDLGVNLGG